MRYLGNEREKRYVSEGDIERERGKRKGVRKRGRERERERKKATKTFSYQQVRKERVCVLCCLFSIIYILKIHIQFDVDLKFLVICKIKSSKLYPVQIN